MQQKNSLKLWEKLPRTRECVILPSFNMRERVRVCVHVTEKVHGQRKKVCVWDKNRRGYRDRETGW